MDAWVLGEGVRVCVCAGPLGPASNVSLVWWITSQRSQYDFSPLNLSFFSSSSFSFLFFDWKGETCQWNVQYVQNMVVDAAAYMLKTKIV